MIVRFSLPALVTLVAVTFAPANGNANPKPSVVASISPSPTSPSPASPSPATPSPAASSPATPSPAASSPATPSPLPSPVAPSPTAPLPSPKSSPSPMPTVAATGTPVAISNALAAAAAALTGSPSASPQAYAAFVKKAERQTGLIDIVKKDDDVYFDLNAAQLDHPFIVAPVLASGIGSDAFAGRIYPTFLMEFKRVGKRILWVQKNTDFTAPPSGAAANALAISVTDSVINSTPIAAEDETSKRVVISAAFFLTDIENVGRDIGSHSATLALFGGPAAPRYSVDGAKSYIERTKTFPKNDELLANLAFSGPPGDLGGAPDGRGVRLRMHYSIVEAPAANGYVPRLADDRVGYFITAQKRFDDDTLATPFLRYIDRWNFKNGPIVYYLTNEIPAQYKPAIRSALLDWNVAFAKVGIPNAIEVKDQPDDPTWDPDDVRYSSVRWITGAPFSAYGPHVEDPRTGEILRVEIVIDGEALRSVKRGYVDQVASVRTIARNTAGLPVAQTSLACPDTSACDTFAADSAEFAATGSVALRALGATPAAVERYAEDWLHSVVLHESGHNFGLRHNFVSATLYSLEQIHDRAFGRAHGIVGSVMGYTPTNLSAPGKPQGEYFQLRLGPYDEWAIRYGYATFPNVRRPADEAVALRGIASESVQRRYAYATDEDANGPLAVDPRVATYHLSNDPLAFDRNQFAVLSDLVARLDRTYPRDGRPYYEERQTFATMLRSYQRAAMLATKFIGGTYTSRDHRGQPGGARPFRPIPREDARRAFALLADNVFSSRALHFSPQLLADLGSNHYLHRGVDRIERPDYPVEATIANMQDAVMFAMFSPDAMSRLADEQYKTKPGERAMALDDLFDWMQAAVWDDLRPQTARIDPLHRALQRRYTNLLVAYALAPSFVVESVGYPSETAPLASFHLRRLARGVDSALRSHALDDATRAHLEDVRSRVRHALDPGAVRGA